MVGHQQVCYADPVVADAFSQFAAVLARLTLGHRELMPEVLPDAAEALLLLATRDPSPGIWLKMFARDDALPVAVDWVDSFASAVSLQLKVPTVGGDLRSIGLCGLSGRLYPVLSDDGYPCVSLDNSDGLPRTRVLVRAESENRPFEVTAEVRYRRGESREALLRELCAFADVPVHVLAAQQKGCDLSCESSGGCSALPQLLMVVPQSPTRTRTVLTTADLGAIEAKARLGLDDASPIATAELRRLHAGVADKMKGIATVSAVAQALRKVLGAPPSDMWFDVPEPSEAVARLKMDMLSYLVVAVNCLHHCRLTDARGTRDLEVQLGFEDHAGLVGPHAGSRPFLRIRIGNESAGIPENRGAVGVMLPIDLYDQVPGHPGGRYKLKLSRDSLARITGVRYGNVLSSIAVVCVGPVSGTPAVWADRVAAVIELDDRRGRIAGIPDPWPYSVRTVCQVVCENPNIRSVLFAGEVGMCADTFRILRDRRPQTLTPFSPTTSQLLSRYAQQVLWTRDISELEADSSLGGPVRSGAEPSSPCLQDLVETAGDEPAYEGEAVVRPQPATASRDSRRSNGIDGPAAPRVAVVPSARQAHRAVLAAVLENGVPSQPDERGYPGVVLPSLTVCIRDTSSDRVAVWCDENDLETYYHREWASQDGHCGCRFLTTFGRDQLAETAERIASLVRDRRTSRGLVVYVADPYRDQREQLGLVFAQLGLTVRDSHVYLDAAFHWRTFEALLGAPYCFYAACRFLEDMVARCSRLDRRSTILPGAVTCVLANVHVFRDDLTVMLTQELLEAANVQSGGD